MRASIPLSFFRSSQRTPVSNTFRAVSTRWSCRSFDGGQGSPNRTCFSNSGGVGGHHLSRPKDADVLLNTRLNPCSTQKGVSRTYATQNQTVSLARTPLYNLHAEHGAKFGPFAGFDMPLYYTGQSHAENHHWVREKCGLFDVSHMVQNILSGPGAEAFLLRVTPSAINEIPDHQSTLSCLLQSETGGIVDDTVITRLGPDSFYFVTNAACRDSDAEYLSSELKKFSDTDGRSLKWEVLDGYALIALQGPKAAQVLQKFVDTDLSTLTFSQCRSMPFTLHDGTKSPDLLVSRTGYTGEDGFEISIPIDNSPETSHLPTKVAKALLQDKDTVRLAGLAARDSLRLEAGMCLYGHDISIDTTPPEAGLGWVVSKSRRGDPSSSSSAAAADPATQFNGSERILSHLAHPKSMGRRRIGLEIQAGGPPAREGAEIVASATSSSSSVADQQAQQDKVIGVVTSGLPSPTLGGKNIAMALVDNGFHKRGTKLKVRIRKNVRDAEVVKVPFVENRFYRG